LALAIKGCRPALKRGKGRERKKGIASACKRKEGKKNAPRESWKSAHHPSVGGKKEEGKEGGRRVVNVPGENLSKERGKYSPITGGFAYLKQKREGPDSRSSKNIG